MYIMTQLSLNKICSLTKDHFTCSAGLYIMLNTLVVGRRRMIAGEKIRNKCAMGKYLKGEGKEGKIASING